MAEKQERKTIFRRIGGRIVPISVGVGSIAAANKITPGFIYKAEYKAIKKARVVLEAKQFKRSGTQYASDKAARFTHLARIKFKDAISKVGLGQYDIKFSAYDSRSFFSPQKGQLHVGGKDLPGFFHELGHAQQYKNKTPSVRLGKAIQNLEIPLLSISDLNNMGSRNPLKKGTAYLKDAAIKRLVRAKEFTAELNRVAQEASAWRRGHALTTNKAIRAGIRKQAPYALSTYAAKPFLQIAKAGLIAGGVGAIAYGLLKKDKKK